LAVNNTGDLTLQETTVSGGVSPTLVVDGTVTAIYNGGGVANYGGTLTLMHSTIANNGASAGGGGVFNSGTLRVGPPGHGTVLVNNHNLFGINGTAGLEGVSPGATDIVPPARVLLPDILDPTLAFHGGRTQTYALVPGSPD
jgi:hypothetical protein